jgi:hypothetical protein
MLNEHGVENKIFYEAVPMLMRLLPMNKKPKRWHNNFLFRLRNKLIYYRSDKQLLKTLDQYDAIIISECYPNAFWRNYFALDELKRVYRGRLISYTESPLDAAPVNKSRHLDEDDYDESIYDFNLFVTDIMEVKKKLKPNQAVVGVNISNNTQLAPTVKKEFLAVLDFAQPGFEKYRLEQLNVLKSLDIKTIQLEGRYPIEEIRRIYSEASVFFLSFPETFGLPIAECLSCGAYIFSPDSSWPMSWRLDESPVSQGPGLLPDCFQIYQDLEDLLAKLKKLKEEFDPEQTPKHVFQIFTKNYSHFYTGNQDDLFRIIGQLN